MESIKIFYELKDLTEKNCDILAEMDSITTMMAEVRSIRQQDGDDAPDRKMVMDICKEATQASEHERVRVLSAYCKHFYNLLKEVSDCKQLSTFFEARFFDLCRTFKENYAQGQQLLAEFNHDNNL